VRTALIQLILTDFRSYARSEIALDGRSVYLVGPNGAGKTNLLEAISLLTPGRGLRNAALADLGRRAPGAPGGGTWAVSAVLRQDGEPVKLGTGQARLDQSRRSVRLEGQDIPTARLSDLTRQVWLTPAQDRLFLESAGDRRRFLIGWSSPPSPTMPGMSRSMKRRGASGFGF